MKVSRRQMRLNFIGMGGHSSAGDSELLRWARSRVSDPFSMIIIPTKFSISIRRIMRSTAFLTGSEFALRDIHLQ
jgi:hypothetical protein